ncbi:MAG: aminotransferase class V-fold PLP-dependent enzyme [Fuerstiella sp.]|nr:aminotransferase class V-fold PLP-dependent enzyme [Fuerstiella sp.]
MNTLTDESFGPWPWPTPDNDVRIAVEQMLTDGSWGRYHGPHCKALCDTLARYFSVKHVHLCSSGTSAVELALRGSNIKSGDEVILAAYDYKANFSNVLTVGARPVLIDTLPGRPVLNPDLLETALSSSTKAIICSHLHGCMAPVEQVAEFAAEHQLVLIEDACQVPGGCINGRRSGTVGHAGILSFGGSKLLTAGRGGAVLTNDPQLAQRIRLYTERGNDAYPLSEMQAAVLLPQIKKLDENNLIRRQSVKQLRILLNTRSSVRIVWDKSLDDESAYYKVALLTDCAASTDRDSVAERVRLCGLPLDPAFPALHLTHAKSRFRAIGELQNAAALHSQLLTLHHPFLLAAADEIDRAAKLLCRI